MRPQTAINPMATRVALHPFLAGMNRTQLVLLTDCAMLVHFAAGQVIFREGEPAKRFFLIETGRVALEASGSLAGPVVIDTVGAGDLLGWSWMFPPHAWHFTARATRPTVAIYFHGNILREYCQRNQALGYELFKRMSAVMVKRLQAARLKTLAIDSQRMALPPAIVQSPFTDQERESARATQA